MKDILDKLTLLESDTNENMGGWNHKGATFTNTKVEPGWKSIDQKREERVRAEIKKRREEQEKAKQEKTSAVDEAFNPNKIYPDTEQGIIQFFSPASGEVDPQWIREAGFPQQCKIHADPSVEGVWAVDSMKNGSRTIVYLGGYKNPWGELRKGNDFETGGLPFNNMKRLVLQGYVKGEQLQYWLKCGSLDHKEFDKLVTFLDDDEFGKNVVFADDINEDPLTGALVGGAIGLALGAKGAYNAGKHAHDDDNEESDWKAGKNYVGHFVKGIVDPRTYIPKRKEADESITLPGSEYTKPISPAETSAKRHAEEERTLHFGKSIQDLNPNDFRSSDEKDMTTEPDMEESASQLNHMGERTYQTYHGWRSACRKAYPGCGFRGDRDIGAATLDGRDVGEWDGAEGSVYQTLGPAPVAEDSNMDAAMADFTASGRQPKQLKTYAPRKAEKWQGSSHIGKAGALKARGNAAALTGRQANVSTSDKMRKPVVTAGKFDEDGVAQATLAEKSVSQKQARTMAAAAHDPKFAKKVGIKTSVAKEFNKADTGTKQLSNAMKNKSEGKIMKKDPILEGIDFGHCSPGVEKVLRRYPHEATKFADTGELADDLFDALFDHYYSNGEMPYGTAKARTGDPYEWVSQKLEAELDSCGTTPLGESEVIVDPEIQEILDKYPHEAKMFKETGELDDGAFFDHLFDHYLHTGEMPYGVAKARDGDPIQWISERLEDALAGNNSFGAPGDIGDFDDHDYPAEPAIEEGPAGDIMPLESADDSDEDPEGFNYDKDGRWVGAHGAYDAAGHYSLEKEMDEGIGGVATGAGMANEEILVEGLEAVITEILEEAGLDHGLDFFFEGGLVVIGRSTARVVMNALKADGRIVETPTIGGIDGEEVRITFNKQPKPEIGRSEVNDLASVPEPEVESSELAQPAITEDVSADDVELLTMQYKSGQLNYDEFREKLDNLELASQEDGEESYPGYFGDTDLNKTADSDYPADPATYEVEAEGEYINSPDPQVHTSTTDMINQGNDLNRPKKSYSSKPYRGDNPMAETRRLMKQYEFMKEGVTKK